MSRKPIHCTSQRSRTVRGNDDPSADCPQAPRAGFGHGGPWFDAIYWEAMERARWEGNGGFPQGGYLSGCAGPFDTIAVRADGVYVPCIQLPGLSWVALTRTRLSTCGRRVCNSTRSEIAERSHWKGFPNAGHASTEALAPAGVPRWQMP